MSCGLWLYFSLDWEGPGHGNDREYRLVVSPINDGLGSGCRNGLRKRGSSWGRGSRGSSGGSGQRRVVALGEHRQVQEIDIPVVIEIALGECLPRGVVILCQGGEIEEIDCGVVVGVAGNEEEVKGAVVASRAVDVAVKRVASGIR